jgi:hypothetical protein
VLSIKNLLNSFFHFVPRYLIFQLIQIKFYASVKSIKNRKKFVKCEGRLNKKLWVIVRLKNLFALFTCTARVTRCLLIKRKDDSHFFSLFSRKTESLKRESKWCPFSQVQDRFRDFFLTSFFINFKKLYSFHSFSQFLRPILIFSKFSMEIDFSYLRNLQILIASRNIN